MIYYKTVDEFSPERAGHGGTSGPGPGSRLQGAGDDGAGDRASLSGLLTIPRPSPDRSAAEAVNARRRAWPVIASGPAAACFRGHAWAGFADITVRLARQSGRAFPGR